MEKNKTALPYVLAALACGAGGFALRLFERAGGSAIPLIGLSAAAVIVFLLAARRMEKKTAFAEVFRPMPADLPLSALSALLLLAGGVAAAAEGSGFSSYLLALMAAAAAAAQLSAALGRRRQAKPRPLAYCLPVLFFVVKLLIVFPRKWMVDPAILDYCFALFALLSFMLGSYSAAALSFDKGNRRMLAFFAMTGVYFGCVTLPKMGLSDALVYGGGAVWMLVCLLQAATPPAASE